MAIFDGVRGVRRSLHLCYGDFITEDLLGVLTPRQILLCPSCGFGRRWVQLAVDKTRVMVECARRF
jgi:hypothetical protein